MSDEPTVAGAAERLRAEFDGAFARPRGEARAHTVDLLAIRVAGEPFALPVRQIAAIARCPEIVALPARAPALLGLAAVRSALVPVFSLARLLGRAGERSAPRWLAVADAPEALALAWEEWEGVRSVRPEEILPAPAMQAGAFVKSIVHGAGEARAVLDLAAMVAALRATNQGGK